MGICYGLCAGVVIGIFTDQLAICLSLGVLFGALAQSFMDTRKANKPPLNTRRR